MKLLDNFYRIVERGDNQCKVAMNANHKIYQAHFPDNPVTPGVCLVQMATEIYQEMSHEPIVLTEIERIKYRNVVSPSDQPSFFFSPIKGDNNSLKAKVMVKDEKKMFTEMSLTYKRGK